MMDINKKFNIAIIIFIIAFLIVFTSMILGCQNNPSEKDNHKNNNTSNIEKELLQKKAIELERQSTKPWSSSILWGNLLKTKSHASFSAKINDKLPEFNFKIIGRFHKLDKYEDFIPLYVEIRNASDGKITQKLVVSDNSGYNERADMVQLVDLNFDGYLDFRILLNAGATGNDWYDSFIYDPLSGKFKYNKELSEMSSLKVDLESKQLTSYYGAGSCEESINFYAVKGNKVILIKSEWTDFDNVNSHCYKITGIPLNGSKKLKIIKKEEFSGHLSRNQWF
mgnify:CR=1 FL=1